MINWDEWIRRAVFSGSVWIVVAVTPWSLAQEKAAAETEPTPELEPDRPNGVAGPLALDHFQDLLSNSPFRRLMSFSEDLALTGVARLPDGAVVTVYDRRAQETYSVAARENAQGWRLVDVTGGRELNDVEATILVGKQEVTLRFDPRRLKPENVRRYQPRTVKPAKRPEQPSVEQWLARLDPDLLRNYDTLDETYRDRFRYSFEDYIEEYPNASSELRTMTARENLEVILEQQEKDRQVTSSNLEELEVGDP